MFINFWDISNVEALLSHTQNYDSTFEMTSFGATKIIRDNLMPTFKVKTSTKLSHVYINLNHKVFDTFINSNNFKKMYRFRVKFITSWFVVAIPGHQFLQIYFIGMKIVNWINVVQLF